MELTLQKYGSYEKFEQATGGSLLSKTRIWSHVRKYMVKEGCLGEVWAMGEPAFCSYCHVYMCSLRYFVSYSGRITERICGAVLLIDQSHS